MSPEDRTVMSHNLLSQVIQYYGVLLQEQINIVNSLKAELKALKPDEEEE